MVVQFELENLELKPDPEPVLTDLIHAVSIFLSFSAGLDTNFFSSATNPVASDKSDFNSQNMIIIFNQTQYLLFKANVT